VSRARVLVAASCHVALACSARDVVRVCILLPTLGAREAITGGTWRGCHGCYNGAAHVSAAIGIPRIPTENVSLRGVARWAYIARGIASRLCGWRSGARIYSCWSWSWSCWNWWWGRNSNWSHGGTRTLCCCRHFKDQGDEEQHLTTGHGNNNDRWFGWNTSR